MVIFFIDSASVVTSSSEMSYFTTHSAALDSSDSLQQSSSVMISQSMTFLHSTDALKLTSETLNNVSGALTSSQTLKYSPSSPVLELHFSEVSVSPSMPSSDSVGFNPQTFSVSGALSASETEQLSSLTSVLVSRSSEVEVSPSLPLSPSLSRNALLFTSRTVLTARTTLTTTDTIYFSTGLAIESSQVSSRSQAYNVPSLALTTLKASSGFVSSRSTSFIASFPKNLSRTFSAPESVSLKTSSSNLKFSWLTLFQGRTLSSKSSIFKPPSTSFVLLTAKFTPTNIGRTVSDPFSVLRGVSSTALSLSSLASFQESTLQPSLRRPSSSDLAILTSPSLDFGSTLNASVVTSSSEMSYFTTDSTVLDSSELLRQSSSVVISPSVKFLHSTDALKLTSETLSNVSGALTSSQTLKYSPSSLVLSLHSSEVSVSPSMPSNDSVGFNPQTFSVSGALSASETEQLSSLTSVLVSRSSEVEVSPSLPLSPSLSRDALLFTSRTIMTARTTLTTTDTIYFSTGLAIESSQVSSRSQAYNVPSLALTTLKASSGFVSSRSTSFIASFPKNLSTTFSAPESVSLKTSSSNLKFSWLTLFQGRTLSSKSSIFKPPSTSFVLLTAKFTPTNIGRTVSDPFSVLRGVSSTALSLSSLASFQESTLQPSLRRPSSSDLAILTSPSLDFGSTLNASVVTSSSEMSYFTTDSTVLDSSELLRQSSSVVISPSVKFLHSTDALKLTSETLSNVSGALTSSQTLKYSPSSLVLSLHSSEVSVSPSMPSNDSVGFNPQTFSVSGALSASETEQLSSLTSVLVSRSSEVEVSPSLPLSPSLSRDALLFTSRTIMTARTTLTTTDTIYFSTGLAIESSQVSSRSQAYNVPSLALTTLKASSGFVSSRSTSFIASFPKNLSTTFSAPESVSLKTSSSNLKFSWLTLFQGRTLSSKSSIFKPPSTSFVLLTAKFTPTNIGRTVSDPFSVLRGVSSTALSLSSLASFQESTLQPSLRRPSSSDLAILTSPSLDFGSTLNASVVTSSSEMSYFTTDSTVLDSSELLRQSSSVVISPSVKFLHSTDALKLTSETLSNVSGALTSSQTLKYSPSSLVLSLHSSEVSVSPSMPSSDSVGFNPQTFSVSGALSASETEQLSSLTSVLVSRSSEVEVSPSLPLSPSLSRDALLFTSRTIMTARTTLTTTDTIYFSTGLAIESSQVSSRSQAYNVPSLALTTLKASSGFVSSRSTSFIASFPKNLSTTFSAPESVSLKTSSSNLKFSWLTLFQGRTLSSKSSIFKPPSTSFVLLTAKFTPTNIGRTVSDPFSVLRGVSSTALSLSSLASFQESTLQPSLRRPSSSDLAILTSPSLDFGSTLNASVVTSSSEMSYFTTDSTVLDSSELLRQSSSVVISPSVTFLRFTDALKLTSETLNNVSGALSSSQTLKYSPSSPVLELHFSEVSVSPSMPSSVSVVLSPQTFSVSGALSASETEQLSSLTSVFVSKSSEVEVSPSLSLSPLLSRDTLLLTSRTVMTARTTLTTTGLTIDSSQVSLRSQASNVPSLPVPTLKASSGFVSSRSTSFIASLLQNLTRTFNAPKSVSLKASSSNLKFSSLTLFQERTLSSKSSFFKPPSTSFVLPTAKFTSTNISRTVSDPFSGVSSTALSLSSLASFQGSTRQLSLRRSSSSDLSISTSPAFDFGSTLNVTESRLHTEDSSGLFSSSQ